MPAMSARVKRTAAMRGRYRGRAGASGESRRTRLVSQQRQAAKKKKLRKPSQTAASL